MEADPFPGLKITDPSVLESLEGRTVCPKCHKSRKYFCYTCYLPVAGLEGKLPRVKLPLKIDIIKHPNEVDGKSTSGHAAVLAPDDVTVFSFPCIPNYDPTKDVLVFPCKEALTLEEFLRQRCADGKKKGPPLSPGSNQGGDSLTTSESADADSKSTAAESNIAKEKPAPCEDPKCDDSVQDPTRCTASVDAEAAADAGESRNGCKATECISVKAAAKAFKTTQGNEEDVTNSTGDAERNSGAGTEEEVSNSTGDAERNSGAGTEEKVTENGSRKRKPDGAVCEEAREGGDATAPAKIPRSVFSARIPRVVFVDSTWKQTKRIVDDERLKSLPRVELRTRTTKFWRSQRDLPMTCLSTIEAIYYFVCDYHGLTCPQPYDGQYDDLLLFFVSTYQKIRRTSNGVNIKAYNR